MARVVGTGKDPLGRYPEGIIGDFPDDSPELNSVLDLGWVREFKPEKDLAENTKWQVANAAVRNDPIVDPHERKVRKEIGEDAHAIVHEGRPDATKADHEAKLEEIDEDREYEGRASEPGEDTTLGAARMEAIRADAAKAAKTGDKK